MDAQTANAFFHTNDRNTSENLKYIWVRFKVLISTSSDLIQSKRAALTFYKTYPQKKKKAPQEIGSHVGLEQHGQRDG